MSRLIPEARKGFIPRKIVHRRPDSREQVRRGELFDLYYKTQKSDHVSHPLSSKNTQKSLISEYSPTHPHSSHITSLTYPLTPSQAFGSRNSGAGVSVYSSFPTSSCGPFSKNTYASSLGGFALNSLPRRSYTGSASMCLKCLSCHLVPAACSSRRRWRCSFWR